MRPGRLQKHLDKTRSSWDRLSKKIDMLGDEMLDIANSGGCEAYKDLSELQKKQHKIQRIRESISSKSTRATNSILLDAERSVDL